MPCTILRFYRLGETVMKLADMVIPNKDFQTSINIEFDFGSKEKIKQLIPTESVCFYLEKILRDIIVCSKQRSKLFVGAYGKGKSHVVLAALSAMWIKDPLIFKNIIDSYQRQENSFADTLEQFVTDGKRLLPVIISGSTVDLRHSLLSSLQNALKLCDASDIMPTTNYDGAICALNRWSQEYPDTLKRYESLTGTSYQEALSKLKNFDTATYDEFSKIYPDLTSGSTFNSLDGFDIISLYQTVLDKLANRGIDGIYIVYDEFSKYLETSIGHATVEDTKLLQDLAEACNRSGSTKQLHLLLISHKSLSNYIDASLPKEKVDGWRGVSGRFEEVEMVDAEAQSYELMSSAILKDKKQWDVWKKDHAETLEAIKSRYVNQKLFDKSIVNRVVEGCFPLHPITAFLLPKLSEKIAQNERTLFTFICSTGEKTMSRALETAPCFITPDYIYDYFEPLLRKEIYTSPLHKIYELTQATLIHIDKGSLAERIVKTVAVIDAVAQYNRVEPTKDTVLALFSDCGIAVETINSTITELVDNNSIVYLKRSNAYLKLKETTGIRIDAEIANRAASLRSTMTCDEALNNEIGNMALYPSRYNEEKSMVRFFKCGFAGAPKLKQWCNSESEDDILTENGHEWHADGEVVGIYCSTPDEFNELKSLAKDMLSQKKLTVVIFPREFVSIDDVLYRLEAARQLKKEADNDTILADEYEIMIEDYSEIVKKYIAGYFQPEFKQSLYFVSGAQKKVITRRRKLSETLSLLCYEVFDKTPRITNESLNKNVLTGTAFSSRSKILKALCAKTLEANLGFVGNGQETSMARSAFENTGLIRDLANSINDPGELEPGIADVKDVVQNFLETASDTTFSVLYEKLTGRDLGIGLREGPIPLYIAYFMRDYKEQLKITYNGEEKSISESLFDDISKNPSAYRVTRLHWSPEIAAYIDSLAKIFDCKIENPSRVDVVESIRLWYIGLPQVTRNAKTDHSNGSNASVSRTRLNFFRAIKRIDCDTDKLLFEDIPTIFGFNVGSLELINAIKLEKNNCDSYLSNCVDFLANTLIKMFDSTAHADASLSSVLKDWIDAHPAVHTNVLSGINNQILDAFLASTGDDCVTIMHIAKTATSLRVDDWNDSLFEDFYSIMYGMKSEVENTDYSQTSQDEISSISLKFKDLDGTTIEKMFIPVDPSPRARLLKNSLIGCLDEMGGALSPEEKRQVVFEVLKGLC